MAQTTSGKIACSDWLRRVTCRSAIFRTEPVCMSVCFVGHFVSPFRTTKGNFENQQKFKEYNKLSTKSCMSWAMNDLKDRSTREPTSQSGVKNYPFIIQIISYLEYMKYFKKISIIFGLHEKHYPLYLDYMKYFKTKCFEILHVI